VLDVEHSTQAELVSTERPGGPYVATPPVEASPPHCWAQSAPPHPPLHMLHCAKVDAPSACVVRPSPQDLHTVLLPWVHVTLL
jgi:hypothetical protein